MSSIRTVLSACMWPFLFTACGGSADSPAPGSGSGSPNPPADLQGLDARPPNATCVAPPRQSGTADVALEREFGSLIFSQPLAMLQAPGDASRWFVLEKTGRVRVFDSDPDTPAFLPDFIDIAATANLDTASEGGLLGMAFHPDYQTNGQVFLSWTEHGSPMTSVIARFTVNPGGDTLNAASRQDVLTLEQDFENHNGGHIAFGPDNLLYIGFGDGGSGGDPLSRAQETRNLLGAMLRIDVDSGSPYSIPTDNPFAGGSICPANPDVLVDDCPEIFAWGLRNPWRFSFDTGTGELWVGDVGQSSREEINRLELGGNYGWDCREGSQNFGAPASTCATASGLIGPVHEYPRSSGVSVTGGYVYRGNQIPELIGNYLFADYGSGRVWRLIDDGLGNLADELLLDTGLSVASFGQGNDGELYVVDIAGGTLHRIVRDSAPVAADVPERLSETGCVLTADPSRPESGLIPYTVIAPFWSDDADKTRWLAIPDGTSVAVAANGHLQFPAGSVLLKQFHLDGSLVETRLLMRHPDGVWAGYSYEWDPALQDGVLVAGGKLSNIDGQDWVFPSSAQCNTCHTAAAGRALGLETLQLNRTLTYPATGRTANQLDTLATVNVLAGFSGDTAAMTRLADPMDAAAALTDRARSYLHTNCSQCHRPGGTAPTDLDLRYEASLSQTNACEQVPNNGDLGLGAGARIIAAGDAARSVLVERMNRRDAHGMPPLASTLIDTSGVALISNWVNGLANCL